MGVKNCKSGELIRQNSTEQHYLPPERPETAKICITKMAYYNTAFPQSLKFLHIYNSTASVFELFSQIGFQLASCAYCAKASSGNREERLRCNLVDSAFANSLETNIHSYKVAGTVL